MIAFPLLDSWIERSGTGFVAYTVVRCGWWLWQRHQGKPASAPLIGWLARRSAVETLLVLTTIRLRTAQAKIDRLEAEIKEAGIRLDDSGDGGFGWPDLTPTRSKPNDAPPLSSTSAKPDDSPG